MGGQWQASGGGVVGAPESILKLSRYETALQSQLLGCLREFRELRDHSGTRGFVSQGDALTTTPEVLDTAQAAHFLRISTRTLEKMRATNCGPPYCEPTPRRTVYITSDLREWLAGKRVG
ncbi:MAG: helix-turn-helix domain-containing protein [Candidatus Latescibacterota bacterium]